MDKELSVRELIAGKVCIPLHRRFFELVWTEQNHRWLTQQVHNIVDNLEEMDKPELESLIALLERYDNEEVTGTALEMVHLNASDGNLYHWTGLMRRHFDQLNSLNACSSPENLEAIYTLEYTYGSVFRTLTPEEEWSVLEFTIIMYSDTSFRWCAPGIATKEDAELINYIASRADQVEAIIETVQSTGLIRPAEIEALLNNSPLALTDGAL